jgi:glycosyltransferase involved in cell wall biosynthesis
VSSRARVGLIGLVAAGQSGVPRYAVSLLRALDSVAQEYDDLQLRLVTTRAGAERVEARTLELRVVGDRLGSPRAGARRIVAEQVAAVGEHGDLLHFFDLTGPLLAPRRRFVTTIHDTAAPRLYKRLVHPWAARHATAAVAVSAYARDEAMRVFGADPRSITVIHSGPGFAPSEAVVGDGTVEEPYVLYVGDLTEHKNVGFLVDVFGKAEVPGRLVLVGRQGAGFDALLARIESSSARDRIVLLHDVDDARLDGLYRHALATALPSRYEGFGFTALEAMARGCPVLESDIPALREVSGDGALLLALDDEAAWADAMRRVVADAGLRDGLRARGAATVARYSWDATARGVLDVLREAGARR